MALPRDAGERVREWADGEEAKAREKDEARAEGKRVLSEAAALVEARGLDAGPLRYFANKT